MQGEAAVKIDDIHAMMASGHRSIRIERHTLILWGVAGALLIVFVNKLFTPEYITVHWQRVLFSNLLIAGVLVLVAITDFRMTRVKRESRDESLSFVQLQLIKLWWLVVALIVLINIGMNVYGGGYLFYPITLSLIGVGLYAQGLFSQQMLSWIGVCLILLSLASIALGISYLHQEWLAISVLGIGFSLLAWWIDYPGNNSSAIKRALLSVVWVLLVLMPVIATERLNRDNSENTLTVISLDTYLSQNSSNNERYIVRVPAGTIVPLNIEISGNLLEKESTGSLPLKLTEDINVVMGNEGPEGTTQLAGGIWKANRNPYIIRKLHITPSLDRNNGFKAELILDTAVNK